MVKKIMRDPLFLAQKSTDATEADRQVITDLLDTLRANLDHCVGMAANMIGVKKNIIVVAAGPFQFAMVNPVITKKTGAFQTEEGCLSLEGVRPCTRYKEIEVDFLDADFKKQHGKYSGWTAQIIQHEIDEDLLRRILAAILTCTYDSDEELKLDIFNAISVDDVFY